MLRKDGLRKSPVSYLDFTVDGERLLDRLNAGAGSRLDKVGVVQPDWPIETVAALEQLLSLAPAELSHGGVPLYTCPECSSPDCGVIAARVRVETNTVVWADICEQYEYTDELFPLGETSGFPRVVFERSSYEAVLQGELDRLRPLCADFEYPYQRRRRLRRERRRAALRGVFRAFR